MATEEKLKPYTDDEVAAKVAELGLTDWKLEDGWLRRKFTTAGWPVTLMLVNAIGYVAEAAYHHPDLAVTWGKVWVKLKTHSAGGITDKDFAAAKRSKPRRPVAAGRRRRTDRHAGQVRLQQGHALDRAACPSGCCS